MSRARICEVCGGKIPPHPGAGRPRLHHDYCDEMADIQSRMRKALFRWTREIDPADIDSAAHRVALFWSEMRTESSPTTIRRDRAARLRRTA